MELRINKVVPLERRVGICSAETGLESAMIVQCLFYVAQRLHFDSRAHEKEQHAVAVVL